MDIKETRMIQYTHKKPRSAAWLCGKLHLNLDQLNKFLKGEHSDCYIYSEKEDPADSSVSLSAAGLKSWRSSMKLEIMIALITVLFNPSGYQLYALNDKTDHPSQKK